MQNITQRQEHWQNISDITTNIKPAKKFPGIECPDWAIKSDETITIDTELRHYEWDCVLIFCQITNPSHNERINQSP